MDSSTQRYLPTQPRNSSTQLKHATQAHNASTQRKHTTQAHNASTQLKHATQALMGATRLASEKDVAIYLVEFVSPSFLYPDARRVAPISACVVCLSCVVVLGGSV